MSIVILNETIMVFIIIYLFCVSSGNKWTTPVTKWFMNVLTTNTMAVFSIIIGIYQSFSFLLYLQPTIIIIL